MRCDAMKNLVTQLFTQDFYMNQQQEQRATEVESVYVCVCVRYVHATACAFVRGGTRKVCADGTRLKHQQHTCWSVSLRDVNSLQQASKQFSVSRLYSEIKSDTYHQVNHTRFSCGKSPETHTHTHTQKKKKKKKKEKGNRKKEKGKTKEEEKGNG